MADKKDDDKKEAPKKRYAQPEEFDIEEFPLNKYARAALGGLDAYSLPTMGLEAWARNFPEYSPVTPETADWMGRRAQEMRNESPKVADTVTGAATGAVAGPAAIWLSLARKGYQLPLGYLLKDAGPGGAGIGAGAGTTWGSIRESMFGPEGSSAYGNTLDPKRPQGRYPTGGHGEVELPEGYKDGGAKEMLEGAYGTDAPEPFHPNTEARTYDPRQKTETQQEFLGRSGPEFLKGLMLALQAMRAGRAGQIMPDNVMAGKMERNARQHMDTYVRDPAKMRWEWDIKQPPSPVDFGIHENPPRDQFGMYPAGKPQTPVRQNGNALNRTGHVDRLYGARPRDNSNQKLGPEEDPYLLDDPYTQALLDQQWEKMAKDSMKLEPARDSLLGPATSPLTTRGVPTPPRYKPNVTDIPTPYNLDFQNGMRGMGIRRPSDPEPPPPKPKKD